MVEVVRAKVVDLLFDKFKKGNEDLTWSLAGDVLGIENASKP